MTRSGATSVLIILVAALLGAALAAGLYQWESLARDGQPKVASAVGSKTVERAAVPTGSENAAKVRESGSKSSASTAAGVSSKDTSAGARVYAANCAACHPGGNAGVGPALRGTAFASKFADDSLLKKLTREGKGNMPPFPAANLGDADLDSLVAYIRSLK